MELATARAQQYHEALWSIFEKTAPKRLPYRSMRKEELVGLAELLYERLEEVHETAERGMAKPLAETAHEALSRAVLTGEGVNEAVALLLNSPLPLPPVEHHATGPAEGAAEGAL